MTRSILIEFSISTRCYHVTYDLAYTSTSISWVCSQWNLVWTSKSKQIGRRIQRLKPMIVQYTTHATFYFKTLWGYKYVQKLRIERILEKLGSMNMQLLVGHLRSRLGCNVILYYRACSSERHDSLPLMYPNKEEHFSRPRIDVAQISSCITRWRNCEHLFVLAATS